MSKNFWVSREGLKRLEARREEIKETIRLTLNKMGESARLDNDLRENPEYMDLRVQAMYTLPRELKEIQEVLEKCQVIEDSDEYQNPEIKCVVVGSKVTIRYSDGFSPSYILLGYDESDLDNDRISYLSALGMSIIGRFKGDKVKLPNGEEVEVVSIERGL